ncbi:MAG: hypothetical protein DME25_12795 [Verrucomicrobia bacterium]|nr:MAG: hypothetical protein DME25_12795 [Verrucomicrobiota bacterium]
MKQGSQYRPRQRWMAILATAFIASGRIFGAETNVLVDALPQAATNTTTDPDQPLREYLKLQEQLHATLLAIEQARLEASQESRAQSEVLGTRLDLLEKSLANQREERLQNMQDSNRTMLVLAGAIVGLGLLAVAFSTLFHSRGMNRLAEIGTDLASGRTLLAGNLPAGLNPGEKLLLATGTADGAPQPLLATIHRLEQRVEELEHSAGRALPVGESSPSNGQTTLPAGRKSGSDHAPLDHLSALLGKGQVLVNLGQAEAALPCYDEALARAPNHAEAHLKKGMALERLKRFGEAIACYDRAIALNPSLTQAFLCKGSAFNQQERFGEALECYEAALRSETK